MDSLFLWEIGPARVWIIWLVVFIAQIAIAEINRRWNWTIFLLWTFGGLAMIPYVVSYAEPIVGWFPVGKYLIMVATATMTGALLVIGKKNPLRAHRVAMWFGILLWFCLVANIMEANIRDITIYFQADSYYNCAANWECLKHINETHGANMLQGLPESRGIEATIGSDTWYQTLAANFKANHVGIDPETGFRTIGGYWNILSALAGILNCITVTGLAKVFVTAKGKQRVQGLIWVDQVWPWIIAYDLWNHAFLYNALADYTWYCSLALLLACTVPAFWWAKGQWIWFRCFTLMFWIAFNNWFAALAVPPGVMHNYATMNPTANILCSALALIVNIALFIYWIYRIRVTGLNPLVNPLFMNLSAFRNVVKLHADDREKYFITDMVKETPTELGFEPDYPFPPKDGFVGYLPWWGTSDMRYPKLRTSVSVDQKLLAKGVVSDSQWNVK